MPGLGRQIWVIYFGQTLGKEETAYTYTLIPNCGNGSGYLGLGLYKSDASRTLGDHHQQGDQKKKGELDTAGTCGGEYNLYLFLLPLSSYFYFSLSLSLNLSHSLLLNKICITDFSM